jgi:class 3 adenylate cyclase
MPRFDLASSHFHLAQLTEKRVRVLSHEGSATFNPSVLGLGDISQRAIPTEAIAAIFDLTGFTHFCRQIDPQLSVPLYLQTFLDWIFSRIRDETVAETHETGVELYQPLPFLIKFMGDGLLVLWDTASMNNVNITNTVVMCSMICDSYTQHFIPTLNSKVAEPPPSLRCGIARGTVLSVGSKNDYVGSCINLAARLQQLPSISLACSRRGFDLHDTTIDEGFRKEICLRRVSIRGIGDNELIYLYEKEVGSMPARDRKFYKEV